MDRIVKRYDAGKDDDLMICERGVAYQRDMSKDRVEYGNEYLRIFESFAYDGSPTAKEVISGRVKFIESHVLPGSQVLDIGAASGAFVHAAVNSGFAAKGFDVIPKTVQQLQSEGLYSEAIEDFDAVTMWDVIEHMEEPEKTLKRIKKNALLFISIPVFDDVKAVRESKHYKPGEHLYYWKSQGFIDWIAAYGFRLIEQSTHETDAGRENIGAFVFKNDLPDYWDHIEAYKEMHSSRHYGDSATELHINTVAKIVARYKPLSILDYGCGRSDLIAHFWLDGKRQLVKYDPAIPAYKRMPSRSFDLVICCDVMEHIPLGSVDRILDEVRACGPLALFTISTKLARAKLPDGRNAHVTLLTKTEWFRWIKEKFGRASIIESNLDFELIVLAGSKI